MHLTIAQLKILRAALGNHLRITPDLPISEIVDFLRLDKKLKKDLMTKEAKIKSEATSETNP